MSLINWLRSHRHWLLLTLTYFLLPLLYELFATWVAALFDQQSNRLIMVILWGLIAALFGWALYLLGRQPPAQVVARERQPLRHPGLIALVSKRNKSHVPAHEVALQYHLSAADAGGQSLQQCWLVATGGPDGTVAEAEDMRQRYKNQCQISIVEVNDAFDVTEVIRRVNAIYAGSETGDGADDADQPASTLRPDQIIADFTGGTSPMSVGLALACYERSPLEYIYGGKLKEIASVPVLAPVKR